MIIIVIIIILIIIVITIILLNNYRNLINKFLTNLNSQYMI